MTAAEVISFIGSELFSSLIATAVGEGVDHLKHAIKIADQNREFGAQNLQTEIYQMIVDALNQFTHNKYKEQEKLYDAAESILKRLIGGSCHTVAVKSGLKILSPDITDDCSGFFEILCHEICKDENCVLYREIEFQWRIQENRYLHNALEENSHNHKKTHDKLDSVAEKLNSITERPEHPQAYQATNSFKIPAKNRAQDYTDKWEKDVFLNHFDQEDENDRDKVNVRLKDIYLETFLPHYSWKEEIRTRDNLKDRIKDYIAACDGRRMLLILGQAGIGKSTLITWIMANLAKTKDQILVYQFASDLEKVYWQSEYPLSEILGALNPDYRAWENKTLILDGFDEIQIDGDRERILNKLQQELISRNFLENFSLIITCRENYIYDLQNIKCDHLILNPWTETQIETFCKTYWNICRHAIEESKIQKIKESKEIYGIPLILYMILALDVSIEKSSSVADVYDQIFSLKNGGIYDRCYDTEHRTNEPAVKKYIHMVTQKISFWIFENNDERAVIYQKNFKEICDRASLEATDEIEDIRSDVLIGSYFKVKHCEGMLADEVNFVHRSIYEYFVVLYFFESLRNLQSKEAAAGKLGELLKRGRLSEQMLQFIKHKFDSLTEYDLHGLVKEIFNIMLRDGMTYHTDITVRDGASFRTDAQYKICWNGK